MFWKCGDLRVYVNQPLVKAKANYFFRLILTNYSGSKQVDTLNDSRPSYRKQAGMRFYRR